MFWENHSPTHPPYSRQYRSAVFVAADRERVTAQAAKARLEQRLGVTLFTEIEPAGPFYLAEEYHQKYYLRGARSLAAEFRAMYPNDADFAASTAAARVNGFVGGCGDEELLRTEIGRYGLSPDGQRELLETAHRRGRFSCRS